MPIAMKDPRTGHMPPLLQTLVDRVMGPGGVPTTPAITIGPNAIPLDDETAYLRKVAGSTIGDLADAAQKPVKSMYAGAKNILGSAMSDPILQRKVVTEQHLPGHAAAMVGNAGPTGYTPEMVQRLIDHLVETFHPTYLDKGPK